MREMRGRAAAALKPVVALMAAAALISLVLIALGASPVRVFAALFAGAFSNWLALTDTLVKSTPLVFTGLAISISFQGALWNIGADGQLMVGALCAGAIGPALAGRSHPLAIAALMLAGCTGGAVWGGVCGYFRARREVNEVISTIMLNFVSAHLLSWAVHGPLMEPLGAYPKSRPIAEVAQLHLYLPPSRLNAGMLAAVVLALACYLFLFRSEAGFELRALGHNRRASAFFGIPIARLTILTMALSGALAGLGGAVQLSAITHRLYEEFSPGWGYEAIAVALVARLNPVAIVPTAILFGALDNGAQSMQRAEGVSPVLVQVIQGLAIMALLAFDAAGVASLSGAIRSGSKSPTAAEAEMEAGDA